MTHCEVYESFLENLRSVIKELGDVSKSALAGAWGYVSSKGSGNLPVGGEEGEG
jgi:hypothetical protein